MFIEIRLGMRAVKPIEPQPGIVGINWEIRGSMIAIAYMRQTVSHKREETGDRRQGLEEGQQVGRALLCLEGQERGRIKRRRADRGKRLVEA